MYCLKISRKVWRLILKENRFLSFAASVIGSLGNQSFPLSIPGFMSQSLEELCEGPPYSFNPVSACIIGEVQRGF